MGIFLLLMIHKTTFWSASGMLYWNWENTLNVYTDFWMRSLSTDMLFLLELFFCSFFYIPGSVHPREPQPPQQEHQAVLGVHTTYYRPRIITQRSNSNTERAEQGQSTPAAHRNGLWRFPAHHPIFQQKQICYYWWSLQAMDIKGWQQAARCHFNGPGSIYSMIIIQRGQV